MTDTVTGLIWLKQSDCLSNANWQAANEAAAGLRAGDCGGSLTDGSSPGDWRLPTKAEWEATIARAVALDCVFGNAPSLTNDAGTGCYLTGPSSLAGVALDMYWSSTTNGVDPNLAGIASLVGSGFVSNFAKGGTLRVWPVRGGPR